MQVDSAQRFGGLVGLLPGQSGRVDVAGQAGIGVGEGGDVGGHPRVDPGRPRLHVLRLGGEPLHQFEARLSGDRGQFIKGRPWPFGVDVIRCQRGHPTPVVDTRPQQSHALTARHQVGRGLDPHVGAQHQSGHRDGCQEVVEPGIRRVRHRGGVLCPEVLHDDFLDVPELLVHPPDRMHGVGTLGEGLPDAHQQAGGERDGQAAGVGQGAHPDDRVLVRAAVVGLALDLEEPPRRGFQHHPHRRRHRLEPGKLGPAHHSGIEVRQQAGLLQHPDGHCPQV